MIVFLLQETIAKITLCYDWTHDFVMSLLKIFSKHTTILCANDVQIMKWISWHMQQTISKTNHCILWVVSGSVICCGGGNLELTRKTRKGLVR